MVVATDGRKELLGGIRGHPGGGGERRRGEKHKYKRPRSKKKETLSSLPHCPSPQTHLLRNIERSNILERNFCQPWDQVGTLSDLQGQGASPEIRVTFIIGQYGGCTNAFTQH